ncbi:zinc finger C4H2 domain-containing protein isoform X2 [Atheta coriaria]|uniref:zinc finger C4H2 domain-containing protein isoform X2 n=1 Tax=Dalotia coriaria TaxID=877792 RepID=UPI0031F383DD
MTEHERSVYAKLEAIKDIRSKTIQLEKIKAKLILELEGQDQEEKCLSEYKSEMEMLLQEKMSHVEELRQIHADINAMEGVIKHAEESRVRAISNASRLHEEYLPLKQEVNRLRRECLGLERLPELHEEEGVHISAERLTHLFANNKPPPQYNKNSAEWTRPLQTPENQIGPLAPPMPPTFLPPPSPLRLVANKPEQGRPSPLAQQQHPGPPAPTFRQQPPPMKSCLSCHQQIHRNAPICPLCKAKSRSRNPKKPKKKDH